MLICSLGNFKVNVSKKNILVNLGFLVRIFLSALESRFLDTDNDTCCLWWCVFIHTH